jgi:glutathione synthase/RimK-type ligase-like ATP-grasp enzyme
MRIAVASFLGMPPDFTDDDHRLCDELRKAGAEPDLVPWDERDATWDAYELVLIRSTWDYSRRRDEFVAWADRVGERLHNPPALVRWNSDKRYLADLGAAGIPVVETEYFAPGDEPPAIHREVVVKPTVSAGGQRTGRFSGAEAETALALIGSIQAEGKTAMVQPFNPSVDEVGETAVVMVDGEFSHALRKRAVLRADEVAPVRSDAIGAAETMYDPGLVTAGEASEAEIETARAVVADLERRFGSVPLYARVDLLAAPDGTPVLLELEAIEPNFYFHQAPGSARRLARAVVARARASASG